MESLYKVKYARHIMTSLSNVHVFIDFCITVVMNGRHLYFKFKYNRFAIHKNNITVSLSLGNGSGNGYILIIFIYRTYPYTVHGSKQFFFFFWWD